MMDFKLIQEKQKELDSKINNHRERNTQDALISFIAEVIEWQETMPSSHKTWKHSVYTRAEQLEEYTDMLFFLTQMYNLNEQEIDLQELKEDDYYIIMKANIESFDERVAFNLLINNALSCKISKVTVPDLLMSYLVIAEAMGYTEEDLEKEYLRKHKINLERINKKRENGGWK